MRIVLFDLGDTLEHEDALLPGAEQTLKEVLKLRDNRDRPVAIALLSDYTAADSPEQANELREEY
jgi:FMN phosphatase YigB (HAD superfamily)